MQLYLHTGRIPEGPSETDVKPSVKCILQAWRHVKPRKSTFTCIPEGYWKLNMSRVKGVAESHYKTNAIPEGCRKDTGRAPEGNHLCPLFGGGFL